MAESIKLISNYTNSIAGTPLDPEVERLRWEKPVIRERRDVSPPYGIVRTIAKRKRAAARSIEPDIQVAVDRVQTGDWSAVS